MAFTLSDLLVRALDKLGQSTYSTATGGTTSTLVDSKQVGVHGDDAWNNGTIIVVRDAGGASAAPEGEFSIITDYVDSSGTFSGTFTAAPATGDRYLFASEFYPMNTMIDLANAALQSLGDLPLVDTSTLTTASNQTEYAYALAWKRNPPIRVDVASVDDANDNRWVRYYDWEYQPDAAGSTGLLVFRLPPPFSWAVRIWYVGPHGYVSAHDDTINELIQPELATLALTEKALEWQNSRIQGGDPFLLQRWNAANSQLNAQKQTFKVWKPSRASKLFQLDRGSISYWPGDQNTV
jgi:hypothetical protein